MPSLDEKIALLLRLPWTLTVDRDPSDDSLTASIAELPEFVASGADERALVSDIHDGLHALFLDYLEEDEDSLPLPAGAVLPWRVDPRVNVVRISGREDPQRAELEENLSSTIPNRGDLALAS